jgi:acyl transferase domain-containing protein
VSQAANTTSRMTLRCLAQVGTLQMHGTGTALGDPIEVNAALAALLPAPKSRAAAAGVCRVLQQKATTLCSCVSPNLKHRDSGIAA